MPRPSRAAQFSALIAALFAALAAAGCQYAPPAAWEKDRLARPAMRLDDDLLDGQNREHVYTSKEGASGGQTVGGGGCGCN